MDIGIPTKCYKVLWDKKKRRYRVLYGGRGSAKSWSTARYLLLVASSEKLRILCTREIQKSIKDSVYRLLVDQINQLGLLPYFIVKADSIVGINGSEFLFRGLKNNIDEIKSTEGVDICWVEEAERVPGLSWDNLIPTVRKDGSYFIIIFNPESEKSETFTRFVENERKKINSPDIARAKVNFWDNPYFPDVLRKEMEWDKKNDRDKYDHIWGGNPKKYGDAVIFKNKIIIEEFETPPGEQLFFGADFGYAQDPSTLVRMHIRDKKLWIDYEAYGVGVEIDELHALFDTVPGSHKWEITADCARPETISHLTRPTKDGEHDGFNIKGSLKGKGSVEDGIMFLRSFEAIVIHPRCKGSIDNFGNYRWKTDKVTGLVLPIPVDKANHVPDACRYALEKWIRVKLSIADVL